MSHNSLSNYYQAVWAMSYHHKMDIETLENLMPYELEIYMKMTEEQIKKDKLGDTASMDQESEEYFMQMLQQQKRE